MAMRIYNHLYHLKKLYHITDIILVLKILQIKDIDLDYLIDKYPEFIKEALKHTEKVEDFSEEFAKKLMGQLAFLYFLQKFILIGMETMPLLSTQITTDFFSHHSFSNAQLFL